jgi:hypothetical protein
VEPKIPFLFFSKHAIIGCLSHFSKRTEDRVLARSCAIAWVLALLLCVSTAPVQGQWLPSNFGVDTSLRAGYLFGWQMTQLKEGPETFEGGHLSRFRTEFNPRLPVLSGDFEWSPIPELSGRLAGAISVLEKDIRYVHARSDNAASSEWDVAPDYRQWEAAGLLHLWTGMGYRFSIVGGYRQEYWLYLGTPANSEPDNSYLRDKINAHIPFIAVQTAMFFPWWKARFEVLGSPFMSKKIDTQILKGGNLVRYNGTADSGGLVEFTVEGTAAVTSQLRIGLYSRYTYQELGGEMVKMSGGSASDHKLNFAEQMFIVCANFTVLF